MLCGKKRTLECIRFGWVIETSKATLVRHGMIIVLDTGLLRLICDEGGSGNWISVEHGIHYGGGCSVLEWCILYIEQYVALGTQWADRCERLESSYSG